MPRVIVSQRYSRHALIKIIGIITLFVTNTAEIIGRLKRHHWPSGAATKFTRADDKEYSSMVKLFRQLRMAAQ